MKRFAWKSAVWFLKLLPILGIAAFLNFYLPSKDVVRIVDTDVKRMDVVAKEFVGEGDGRRLTLTRDVRFINAAWPDGRPRVYRNEETGWDFPWYFKFDSGNLQSKAQDLRSLKNDPIWVVVTHYGWRIELFSMFPNAVEVRQVDSPDYTAIPWFNIVFLTLLAGLLFYLWRLWRRFVENRWQPFMRRLELDERFENASNGVAQVWRWLKANFRDRRSGLKDRPEP